MASFNRVILMGNLTRDPEQRFLPAGTAVCDFSIAVNERYQDKKTQEWVDRPNFIDCSCFGKSAESIPKYFAKGSAIHIEGRLRFEQWDDKESGQKRSKLKVVVDQWTFCESKGGGDNQQSNARPPQQRQAPQPAAAAVINDEDIPF